MEDIQVGFFRSVFFWSFRCYFHMLIVVMQRYAEMLIQAIMDAGVTYPSQK